MDARARSLGRFAPQVRESSLVWNYKYADPEFGRLQARDLLQHLCTGPISNAPVDIVQGARSVEARPVGVSKGAALQSLMSWMRDAAGFAAVDFEYILCVGHYLGRDENLFTFLNGDGIGAVHKEHGHGHGPSSQGSGTSGNGVSASARPLPRRNHSLRTVGFLEPPMSAAPAEPGSGVDEPRNPPKRSPQEGGASTSLLTNMVRVLDLEAERGQRIPGWRASRTKDIGGAEEEERLRERDAQMAAQRRRILAKCEISCPSRPSRCQGRLGRSTAMLICLHTLSSTLCVRYTCMIYLFIYISIREEGKLCLEMSQSAPRISNVTVLKSLPLLCKATH